MIVGLDDFNAYSGNYEDKPEAVKLKTLLLESAEDVVTRYLGYGIEEGKAMGHWDTDKVPSMVILTILRIATLMLTEGGGNIGLTGKSFADNSRTFVNYSNYRKYLQPLEPLREVRF